MSELGKIHEVLERNLTGERINTIAWCSKLGAPRYALSNGTELSLEVHVSTTDYDLACTILLGDLSSNFWPSSEASFGEPLPAISKRQAVTSAAPLESCIGKEISSVHVAGSGQHVCICLLFADGRQLEYSTSFGDPTMSISLGTSA